MYLILLMAACRIPSLVALKRSQSDPRSIECPKGPMTRLYVIMDEIRDSPNAVVLINLGIYCAIKCPSAMFLGHIPEVTSALMKDTTLGIEVALTQGGKGRRTYQVDLDLTTGMVYRTLEIRDRCRRTDPSDLTGIDHTPRNIIVQGIPTLRVHLAERLQWLHRDPLSLNIQIELLLFRETRILIERLLVVAIPTAALSGMRIILVLSGVLVGHLHRELMIAVRHVKTPTAMGVHPPMPVVGPLI